MNVEIPWVREVGLFCKRPEGKAFDEVRQENLRKDPNHPMNRFYTMLIVTFWISVKKNGPAFKIKQINQTLRTCWRELKLTPTSDA